VPRRQSLRFAIQDEHGAWQEIAARPTAVSFRRGIAACATGLGVRGPEGATASFDYFTATPGDEKLFTK